MIVDAESTHVVIKKVSFKNSNTDVIRTNLFHLSGSSWRSLNKSVMVTVDAADHRILLLCRFR